MPYGADRLLGSTGHDQSSRRFKKEIKPMNKAVRLFWLSNR